MVSRKAPAGVLQLRDFPIVGSQIPKKWAGASVVDVLVVVVEIVEEELTGRVVVVVCP